MFSVARDHKGLLEVFKRLSVPDYFLGDPVLRRDGGNIGSVLSPHDVSLMKAVGLLKKILLLLESTGTQKNELGKKKKTK